MRMCLLPGDDRALAEELLRQGAELVGIEESPTSLVVHRSVPHLDMGRVLKQNPQLHWVQLPSAGIEKYLEAMRDAPNVLWTTAKGAYAKPVGEHALLLTLGALRGIRIRAQAQEWGPRFGTSLHGLNCVVIGGGGVGAEVVRLYKTFDTSVTVVRRTSTAVPQADITVTYQHLHKALQDADVVALAAAATPETYRLMGSHEFGLLAERAVLVNVGRGSLVDTDALVDALNSGRLGAAGLDVTDPEPLPREHHLWGMQNCLITPHTADTGEMVRPLIRARVLENYQRIRGGRDPLGLADLQYGY